MPARKVTPYAQRMKNDIIDSIAIAEAAGRPGIRAVAVKSVEQQNLMLHRLDSRRYSSAHSSATRCVHICRIAESVHP